MSQTTDLDWLRSKIQTIDPLSEIPNSPLIIQCPYNQDLHHLFRIQSPFSEIQSPFSEIQEQVQRLEARLKARLEAIWPRLEIQPRLEEIRPRLEAIFGFGFDHTKKVIDNYLNGLL